MKANGIILILLLIIFGVSTVNADIYTWTDEKGVRHYGDSPPENAKDARIVFPEYQYDESADKKRSEQDEKELESLVKELDKENAEAQAEEKRRVEAAQKNREPTQQELIEAEKERLQKRIKFLEEQPLEYFGSQKNKTVRIGFYRYRLEALLEDPDKYFKQPASFEGNVKNPAGSAVPNASGGAGN